MILNVVRSFAKKRDSHRFSCRTMVGNKGIPRTRIGWQSPFFALAHFCRELLAVFRLFGFGAAGEPGCGGGRLDPNLRDAVVLHL